MLAILRAARVPSLSAGSLTVIEFEVDPASGWSVTGMHVPLG